MARKSKTRRMHRDAGTGQFVTEEYAGKHKKTTVAERVKKPSKKKGR